MQRFVLEENIRHFQAHLAGSPEPDERARVQLLLAAMERELALLEASQAGATRSRSSLGRQVGDAGGRTAAIARFQEDFAEAGQIAALIDPAPGLVYVEVNPAYEQVLGVTRDALVGTGLFEQFPDNPDDPAADGVYNVYMSLRRVAETGQTHALPLQRYDVQGADGGFAARYWRIVNIPLLDAEGRLVLILNTAEEVSGEAAGGREIQGTDDDRR